MEGQRAVGRPTLETLVESNLARIWDRDRDALTLVEPNLARFCAPREALRDRRDPRPRGQAKGGAPATPSTLT